MVPFRYNNKQNRSKEWVTHWLSYCIFIFNVLSFTLTMKCFDIFEYLDRNKNLQAHNQLQDM